MEKLIINNSKSLPKIVGFLKKYFDDVQIIKNEGSNLSDTSQNFHTTILFKSRGEIFSIKWNYAYCTLFLGDITKGKHNIFQYTFTKIKLDYCYPIEIGNNYNIVFYSIETINEFDELSSEISPVRFPVTLKSID